MGDNLAFNTTEFMTDIHKPGDHKRSILAGGREREYILHVPPGWNDRQSIPLVIMFHGGGGTAKLAALGTRWSEKADEQEFFVVYPQAARPDVNRPAAFLRNPPFWNVGAGIGYGDEADVDDNGFMSAIFDELFELAPIDRDRIFATGFSNGASMALQTALTFPEYIAAAAPVSGHLHRRTPALLRPISMLFIIGDSDPLNPTAGGPVTSPWGRLENRPPIRRSVETWASWLGCSLTPRVVSDVGGVRRLHYGPGQRGGEVDFITITDAGHVWPGGPMVLSERIAGQNTDKLDATDVIWDFFADHKRMTNVITGRPI